MSVLFKCPDGRLCFQNEAGEWVAEHAKGPPLQSPPGMSLPAGASAECPNGFVPIEEIEGEVEGEWCSDNARWCEWGGLAQHRRPLPVRQPWWLYSQPGNCQLVKQPGVTFSMSWCCK
jgi:hypothetical protein